MFDWTVKLSCETTQHALDPSYVYMYRVLGFLMVVGLSEIRFGGGFGPSIADCYSSSDYCLGSEFEEGCLATELKIVFSKKV